MFGFFKKKEMDIDAAKSFWDWYVKNDSLLIDKLKSHSMDIVDLIDSHLSLVFPYFKNIEFQLGGLIDGKYEFLFFHCVICTIMGRVNCGVFAATLTVG